MEVGRGEWGILNTWALAGHLLPKSSGTATEYEKLHHKHAMKKWWLQPLYEKSGGHILIFQ